MTEKYTTDLELSLRVRFLTALAFVPENGVIDTFEQFLYDNSYFIKNKDIFLFYNPLIAPILKTHG